MTSWFGKVFHNIMVTTRLPRVEVSAIIKSVPRVGLLVGEICAKPPTHAENRVVKPMLPVTC
jgi:hypothetical protein